MKPYQVKLRIFGVLSLILAVLVASIPMPSKAVESDSLNTYFNHDSSNPILFSYKKSVADAADITVFEIKDDITIGSGSFNYVIISPGNSVDSFFGESEKLEKITFRAQSNGITFTEEALTKMFYNCKNLKEVLFIAVRNSISANNDAKADSAFEGCEKLEQIDLTNLFLASGHGLSSVKRMFYGCTALKTIDLSAQDFSNITTENAAEMFKGCDALQTIKTPVNIPAPVTSGATTTTVEIELPGEFKKEGTVGGPYYKYLPTRGTGAGYVKENESITLVRSHDLTQIEVTCEDSLMNLEPGDTRTLQVKITPADATTREVTLTTSDATKVKFTGSGASSTGDTATVTVNNDGTALVMVQGVAAGDATVTATAAIDASLSATVTTGNEISSVPVPVTVVERSVAVEDLTVSPGEIEVSIGTPEDVVATIEPYDATDKTIAWNSGNEEIATVSGGNAVTSASNITTVTATIKGFKPGVTHVTATDSAGHRQVIAVTVTTPYRLLTQYTDAGETKYTDTRKDTSNQKETTATSGSNPYTSDLYLYLERGENTPSNNAFGTQLAASNGVEATDLISYFTIKIADINGTVPEDADELGRVRISMALPGDAMYSGKSPQIYAYNTVSGATQATLIGGAPAAVGTDGSIQGVAFEVDSSGLAQEYALVMSSAPVEQTFEFRVKDNRSSMNTTARFEPAGNGVLTENIYLQIKELTTATASRIPGFVNANNVLRTMDDLRAYYDIYTSRDEAGNERADAEGVYTIRMEVPAAFDRSKGEVSFVRENSAKSALDTAFQYVYVTDSSGKQYVEFTADHFSEYAVLFEENSEEANNVIVTSTAGGRAGASQNSNGTSWLLWAIADEGYAFAGWNDAAGNNLGMTLPLEVTPTGTETYTALFSRASSDDNGSNNNGNNSGNSNSGATSPVIIGARGPGNVTQVPSTNGLVVVASPNEGARFVEWQDAGGASLGTDLSLTVPQNATEVLAVFEPLAANNTASSTTTSGSSTGTSGNTGTTTTDSSTTSGTTASSTTTSGSGTGSSGSETGTSGSSGTGATSNANNMPRTGSADMYRIIFVLLLVFSGTVEVLLSIPKKRRVRHA